MGRVVPKGPGGGVWPRCAATKGFDNLYGRGASRDFPTRLPLRVSHPPHKGEGGRVAYPAGQPLNSPAFTTVSWARFRGFIAPMERALMPVNRSIRAPLMAPPVSDAYQ